MAQNAQSIVVRDPLAVRARLADLGVPHDLLLEGVKAWSAAEASASPFEPVTAPGTKGWIAAVGVLRESFSLLRWEPRDDRNCPLIVHPDRHLAVAVTSGCKLTGSPEEHVKPTTKNPKGIVLSTAVRVNGEQQAFNFGPRFNAPRLLKPRRVKNAERTWLTWLLMIHTTPAHIFAELSLPAAVERGYIVDWNERIVLERMERQPSPTDVRRPAPDLGGAPEIDVPVVRK